ncbi:putative ATP-grasp-modified RiPP [Streptomyces sp. NPDC048845]|uniref:putative ATP-grasp-modified RiPP n=1 Tax=Streptomyces sp. NPDC048845 TaxID=3155390 RepID=UPI00343E6092
MTVSTPDNVPFGVRELRPAHVVRIDPSKFTYDHDKQLNVMADGRLWASTAMAASSTATNNDSTSGADETSDPYAFPGDASAA